MSNSLTINVPKIVQTRNTLNAVPSGSTAEVDNNVKYVPQTLTDAQKALIGTAESYLLRGHRIQYDDATPFTKNSYRWNTDFWI